MLFLDLDDFKSVNDTLGHAVGDQLIKEVADRLRASAADVAQKIIASLEAPFMLAGRAVPVRASVGVAVSSPGKVAVDELLSDADAAMCATKSHGKDGYHVFEPRNPGPGRRPEAIAVGAWSPPC